MKVVCESLPLLIYISLVDRMLDMGHLPDIKLLFHELPLKSEHNEGQDTQHPTDLQVMMFTATLMPKVMHLVSRYQYKKNPTLSTHPPANQLSDLHQKIKK